MNSNELLVGISKRVTAAEHLARFIAVNWHYCPIDERHNVPDCVCWNGDHCAECLLENAAHIVLDER